MFLERDGASPRVGQRGREGNSREDRSSRIRWACPLAQDLLKLACASLRRGIYTSRFAQAVLNRYLIRAVLFRLHMTTFIPYQPRPAVVLALRDKTHRPPAPHHHALSTPYGVPVPHALLASISSERSCQRARRPALEECDQ